MRNIGQSAQKKKKAKNVKIVSASIIDTAAENFYALKNGAKVEEM